LPECVRARSGNPALARTDQVPNFTRRRVVLSWKIYICSDERERVGYSVQAFSVNWSLSAAQNRRLTDGEVISNSNKAFSFQHWARSVRYSAFRQLYWRHCWQTQWYIPESSCPVAKELCSIPTQENISAAKPPNLFAVWCMACHVPPLLHRKEAYTASSFFRYSSDNQTLITGRRHTYAEEGKKLNINRSTCMLLEVRTDSNLCPVCSVWIVDTRVVKRGREEKRVVVALHIDRGQTQGAQPKPAPKTQGLICFWVTDRHKQTTKNQERMSPHLPKHISWFPSGGLPYFHSIPLSPHAPSAQLTTKHRFWGHWFSTNIRYCPARAPLPLICPPLCSHHAPRPTIIRLD
jgi:hypothetical protein